MPTPYKCQNQVRVLVGRFGDVAQQVERRSEEPGHCTGSIPVISAVSTCSSVVELSLDKRTTKVRFLIGGLPVDSVVRVPLLQSGSHRFESDTGDYGSVV